MTQIHWANPVSGSFTNAADWSGGVVPGAGDDAILDAAGVKLYSVVASADETVGSIQTAANATLYVRGTHEDFTATNGTGAGVNAGTIAVGSGATFTTSGVVNNSGLISLAADTADTRLAVETIGVTLTGGGHVTLGANASYASFFSGGAVTNVDNTISGEFFGQVTRLTNEAAGVIDATNGGIYDFLAAHTIVNSGLIENTGSGYRAVNFSTLDQSGGGVIFAADGSAIGLGFYGTVVGGTLKTAGTGVISLDKITFDGRTSTINNQGSVSVGAGSLAIEGAINNAGVISLEGQDEGGGRAFARLTVDSGGATLTGAGSVVLSSTGLNIVTGASAAAILTNIDNTISGAGLLGFGAMGLTNEAAGVVDANDTLVLIFDTGAGAVVNAGLIEATGTGGLVIRTSRIDGSGGGTILARNGAYVALRGGATLAGGALETVGSGVIRTAAGAAVILDGTAFAIHNQGKFTLSNNSALTLSGSLDNTGRFQLTASGASAVLTIAAAGASLSGGGKVLMSDSAGNTIVGASSAAALTNVDNVISGADDLGDGALTLVNEAGGVIVGSLSASLIVDTGANTVVNAGAIVARGSGGLTIQSAVDNGGVLETDGGTLIVNGAVSGAGDGMIYGGTLDFAASFSQNVVFQKTTGELELAQSRSYSGTITGFAKTGGTSLDLRDIGFVSSTQATFAGTAAGGVLTVTDGTHTAHIALRGDYTASTFIASSDGHGGTTVVDPTATSSSTMHRFIAAAAGLGARNAGPMNATRDLARANPIILAKPGVMLA